MWWLLECQNLITAGWKHGILSWAYIVQRTCIIDKITKDVDIWVLFFSELMDRKCGYALMLLKYELSTALDKKKPKVLFSAVDLSCLCYTHFASL